MIFKYNGDTNSISGIKTWIKSFKSSKIDIEDIMPDFNKFAELFNKTQLSAEACGEQLGITNTQILSYAKSCKNGELTQKGLRKSLQQTTIASKAASVGMKALAVAGNM